MSLQPGPAPKPDAQRRRRNAVVAMTKLPANGRQGPPPAWPLLPDIEQQIRRDALAVKVEQVQQARNDATNRQRAKAEERLDAAMMALSIVEAQIEAFKKTETDVWAELWASPQAVAWEGLRYHREVAQYVRWKVRAEFGSLAASTEARQLGDRLGLTPASMLRLRWEIASDELGAARAERRTPAKKAAPRVRAVDLRGATSSR